MRKLPLWALIALAGICACHAAKAEVGEVRIASTIGLAQFPGRVAHEMNFISTRAAALGIQGLKTSFQAVTSGVVVSDLLLSGHADVGIGGNVPLFSLWDKTNGRVKGIAALSEGDMFLVSCDPKIKSIKDYTDNDRISMTDLKTTTYAMMLQMEAAKVFGWENRDKFEKDSVAMSDTDGMGAILSCKTDVKSQMTILPQSTIELKSGKGHVIFSSEDILGHPYTFDAAFGTAEFERANPLVSRAIVLGLKDAIDFIENNPEKAADLYMKEQPFPGTRDVLVDLIKKQTPDHFSFTETPKSTMDFMKFMHDSGSIKKMPSSWKDAWFENIANLPGD
jgi:NitT/TauT family transport system substrate-binding protein